MRLLHVRTLELHYFVPDKVPEYVILSHTWESEEVTFENMNTGHFRNRGGFSKLQGACNQASRDGYSYIWIDSCCIDKSSSSELQESINSMYNWYRDAHICYAYLSDVPDEPGSFPATWFRKSRWFTRAWTLQELLAPSSVEFFSRSWSSLGTKHQRAAVIEEITGISEPNLFSFQPHGNLSGISSAMIFSWAACRRVTREEDVAYSLLGLCNLQMPLLYGEGSRSAFRRLQELILQQKEDATIFLWTHCPVKGQLPLLADHPSWFCRRGPECGLCEHGVHDFDNLVNFGIQDHYEMVIRTLLPSTLARADLVDLNKATPGEAMNAFRFTQTGVHGMFRMFELKPLNEQPWSYSTWLAGLSLQIKRIPTFEITSVRETLICIPLAQSHEGFRRLLRPLYLIRTPVLSDKQFTDHGLHSIFIYHESNSNDNPISRTRADPQALECLIGVEDNPLDLIAWDNATWRSIHSVTTHRALTTRITSNGRLHFRNTIEDYEAGTEIRLVLRCMSQGGSFDYIAFRVVCFLTKEHEHGKFRQHCRLMRLSGWSLGKMINMLLPEGVYLTNFNYEAPERDMNRGSDRLTFKCASGSIVEVALRRGPVCQQDEWWDDTAIHRWSGTLYFSVWQADRLKTPTMHRNWDPRAWWSLIGN